MFCVFSLVLLGNRNCPEIGIEMAERRRSPVTPLVLAALCLGAGAALFAQPPRPASTGSLSGKLTDLRSSPLGGIAVVLRNGSTGAEARTTTARNGVFRFTALDVGEYTIEADSPQLGNGHLEGIFVSAGHEAHVQAAIEFERPPPVLAAVPAPIPAPQLPLAVATAPAPSLEIASEPAALSQPAQPAAAAPNPPSSASQPVAPARQLAALIPIPPAIHPAVAAPMHPALTPPPPLAPALAAGIAPATALQPVLRVHPVPVRPIVAAARIPDPVSSAVTTTITAQEVQSLPVSGRRWQEFVLDTPASTTAAASSQPSLRGASQEPADITVDGASMRLAFGAAAGSEPRAPDSGSSAQSASTQSGMAQAWNGGRGFSISESGIREVQAVAGNVEAEGARGAGGRVNLKTESGTNQFHGQAFLFDRQNTWGARNPFTQWVQNTGTSAAPAFTPVPFTPPDHETVWGFGLGSRIRRDKLFWFAALDSYHRNDPGVATVKNPAEFFYLPTPNDPQIQLLGAQLGENDNQAYNDYLGVPNSAYAAAGLEQLDQLLGLAPRATAQWVGFARVDWQAAERHRFTVEGIGANSNAPGGGLTRTSESFGNHSFGSSSAGEQWLLARWEAYLTPNLLATTQLSAGRDILTARPDAPSAFEQGLLKGNAWGQLPQIVVDSRYGFTIGNPSRFGQGSYPDERLLHAQENVDWVRNTLLLKAGFELDHNADATSLLRNETGTYYYSKIQNFIGDALAFEKFGLTNLFNYENPHNCNPTATALGALPCYSYYSQTMGPTNWRLSTSDLAGYVTAQWQPAKLAVFSVGLRWDREQMPPPLPALLNPDLPLTQKLPSLGNNWGPRISLAIGGAENHWPVLRLGYGMYYGRTENATIETALTQTGSAKGDQSFFIRSTDGLNPITLTSGAPPFPSVLTGPPASVVAPGAVQFAPNFRNPEVHQAVVSVEEALPGHLLVTAAALASLGRRLPISIDTNLPSLSSTQTITYGVVDASGLGPIKSSQITVPFYASWPSPTGALGRPNPSYQQISEIMSRANSTYEAAMVKVTRYGRRGLTLHAHYTYAHAMDWNPNETTTVAGSDVLDPASFSQEYGTSNLDVRHSAAAMVIYESPWKLHGLAGYLANGWMLSGIGQFRGGLPYTMRTSGSLAEEHQSNGTAIVGLAPGMNGSGGDNRVYGLGAGGRIYNIGRNTYRYPYTWKADLRLGKSFDLGQMRRLELLAESFNLFNHQNVTELETTGYYLDSGSVSTFPTLNFLTGLKANTTAFGQPLNINATDFYRERQIQIGLRMRF
jgi:hypothetical protein